MKAKQQELTFPIGIAHDVFLDSLLAVILRILFVLHPRGDGEVLVEGVVQLHAGDLNGVGATVKSKDLVLFLTVICGQWSGPVTDCGGREQIHAAC